eukprot:scaffold261585_cov19-Tisochrysis_lutea.AAC.1
MLLWGPGGQRGQGGRASTTLVKEGVGTVVGQGSKGGKEGMRCVEFGQGSKGGKKKLEQARRLASGEEFSNNFW